MRRLGVFAARRVAAASAVAIALAAGISVGAPSASASVKACAWQQLPLENGWHSEQAQWGTGHPAFCISHGMVYLSGSIASTVANSEAYVTVLPASARPAKVVYLNVYTYAGTTGYLVIGPNGAMQAIGSNASSFTSLAGASFPTATLTASPLTLLNGWKSGKLGGHPAIYVTGGIEHLFGSLVGTSATSMEAATVPPPSGQQCLQANVFRDDDAFELNGPGQIQIDSSGDLVHGTGGLVFSSLDGISYPVAPTAWQSLTMQNGWQTGFGCGTASYEISGGVVYLSGEIQAGSSGSSVPFGVLPASAWPTHYLYMSVWQGATGASLEITPNGTMSIFGGDPNAAVGLGGISYHTLS